MSLLAKRYAGALFEAAQDQGALDAVAADLATLGEVLTDAGARRIVVDPDVPQTRRTAAATKMVESAHALTRNLVGVMAHRHRLAALPEVPSAFHALLLDERGELEGVVETAQPLAADSMEELQAIAGRLTGKQVALRQKVEPELIGGVRLRVGNTLYDGSVATALAELERKLMTVPL